ncbi:hypothetical protein MAIC_52670 [Mycolicibacterium aichiense]|uniref:Uncharacterized protein n=1 Tax=Mycolicibacterium aichiense TaxID=1799 RepID=A0AAD1HT36_9MYCO|nr:hypothetical protein MAIC_52670 [Mycolicibacterium aichiense]
MGLAGGRQFRVATTRDTEHPSHQTGDVTSPHAEPRLADIVELPLARVAGHRDPAGEDDEREPETIILLW